MQVEEEKSEIILKGHNSYRNRLINNWLAGNNSTQTIREALGIFDYMGKDYPISDRRTG